MSNSLLINQTTKADWIVIDAAPLLTTLFYRYPFYNFYERFSLHDIIAHVLSINMLSIDNESIWIEVENRFYEDLESLNMDLLGIFFEGVIQETDNYINQIFQSWDQQEKYVFDRWIDSRSLMLKKDATY